MKKGLFWVAVAGVLLASDVRASNGGYVIITTTDIVAQSTELAAFTNAKSARGFDVEVVVNTPAGWGGGVGTNAALNIRRWLQTHYLDGGEQVVDCVLLIGNPNPTNGAVPMMGCYPFIVQTNGAVDTTSMVPTDFFYADLVGNWDVNSNGYFGDYYDYCTNNGPNRAYAVAVGRIPFYGSLTQLDAILRKTREYENAAVSERAWRRKVLLACPDLIDLDYIFNGRPLGEAMTDEIVRPAGFRCEQLYSGSLPWCAVSNTIEVWNGEHPGVVAWFTHGSPTAAADVMDALAVGLLNNERPAFVIQGSCLNGKPEVSGNLGYALLENGGATTVSASREAYFFPMFQGFIFGVTIPKTYWFGHGTAPRILYDYLVKLVGEEMTAGDALYTVKAEYAPLTSGLDKSNASALWANYLMFNLYGDPSLGLSDPCAGMSGSF